MSEHCEQMNERTNDWPSTYVGILSCSGPQCGVEVAMAATAAAASATSASNIADADSRLGFGGGRREAPGGRLALPWRPST